VNQNKYGLDEER